ncbi:ABC transporter substrate-binding protein [Candidatus Synechococcus calcipolaris G9]|uniref:ABC transporter substrate-binding protein n=1 Tax=Candidatus Synechococcus calcipolaris G9 TaxID=1497997 RepID=A0ABT6EWZ5_9SYNE|nr:ABC transporter substrate-binding protein [Candidatus Synechococcus calcipolaris]MDG2990315.1 ABC transporter substrate-binding protein [Candidatus Synechococcus calcipolaris G9]
MGQGYRQGWQWILVIFVVLTVFIGGCSPQQFRAQSAEGSQLITSVLSDPKTFNYLLSQESPNVFGYIYEGLLRENGVTGELEPGLAESWQVNPETLEITFTLQPGLKWSDGEPLTSEDVVFTYNDLYLNTQIPTDTRDILRIGREGQFPAVMAMGDLQVKFTLPEPFAPFLRTTGLPILPAHILRPYVEQLDSSGKPLIISMWGTDTDPAEVIANGPFIMDRYRTNQRLIFRRNPYYWKQPEPYLERLIWQIVESTDTAMLQFRSGGLDVLGVTPENFALLKREEKPGNFRIYNGGPSSTTNFISFNLNKGQRNGRPLVDPIKSAWFNNVTFRRAIAHAIDRQRMINNVYQGLGELQNSPISVQSPYFLSPEQGLKVYAYDPEMAKELLLGAGFRYNNRNQLEDAQGNRVRFSLMTNAGNKVRESLAAQIMQDLGQIGIQVDLQFVAFGALVDKLSNTLEWDCHLLGFTGGTEPNNGANIWLPDGLLHSFNQKPSPEQEPLVGREVADWEQRIGDLYIQGAQELDESQRKAIYAETQQLTQEYLPFIYLVNPYSLSAFRNHVTGVKPSGLGGPLWNISEIKIQE